MAHDPELTRLLVQELERHLRVLEEGHGRFDETARDQMRRALHALKGSAGLAGEPELSGAMQRLERRVRDGGSDVREEAVETIATAIKRLSAGEPALAGGWPEPPPDLAPRGLDPLLRSEYVAELTDRLAQIDGALAHTEDLPWAAAEVFRHVHTIKGAASAAGDEPMAWFCHGLEERLGGGSSSNEAALRVCEEVARYRAVLGGLLEDPEATLVTLRGLPARPRSSLRPPRPSGYPDDELRVESDATIRVSAQAVDRMLGHVGGITVARERVAARSAAATRQARTLRRLRADLAEALRLIGPPRPWGAPAAALRRIERAAQALAATGDELDRVAEQMRDADTTLRDHNAATKRLLSAMRQTPVRGLFGRVATAAQIEARRKGCELAIRTSGADETIDRRLAEQIVEPCLQLARNAVAHGIEAPATRESLGKPRTATLTLGARRSGGRLVITVGDDGAGVDVARVRARAVEAGVVTDALAGAADDQTLLELLFLPGFSTRAQSPDLLAGRGIGLDITLAAVQKLGGTIRLSSKPGLGFEARVEVPVETGLAAVLWVRAGDMELALPVVNAVRVRAVDRAEGERIPHLAACLEALPSSVGPAPYAVELDVGDERLAVGVDSAGTIEEVLVRALSPLVWGLGPFSGAVVRGDGKVHLALDPHALAPRARALALARGVG